MDEYDYESDSFDEDTYDEEFDSQPFFGNLLKSQAEIKEAEAKEAKEREEAWEKVEQQKEEIRKSQRISERKSVQKEVPQEDVEEDNFSDGVVDNYEDEDDDHYTKSSDKKKPAKRDRKCILCSETNPKTKFYTLKGVKCRKDDIEGKLHKMLGTMPVFCLPGNPYICEECYKRTLETFSMWDLSMTGLTEYLEEEEPPDIPKTEIKELETKLQRVVKKYCAEKLSHLDEDITIMGNVYVSLSDRAMVMFPIDSTAEIQINNDDDSDDDDNDDNNVVNEAPPPEENPVEDEPADNSFQNEDLGGILDANMGRGMLYTSMADFDLNFDDIEVDVEVNVARDSGAIDFETLARNIKNEPEDRDVAGNDLEVETIGKEALKPPPAKIIPKEGLKEKDKTAKPKKKQEPSVTVNISYKDIQKAEEALIKNNHIDGRCPACKIRFYPGEYIRHTDTSERKKCEHCVFQTSLVCVLRKHVAKNHKNLANNKPSHAVNNSAKALFKCDKCSKCFATHFLLNKHRIFFHGSKLIYPEYVKGRVDDELSAGSSDEEQPEEEVAENDPDYMPSFFDDDEYAPKKKKKKIEKEKEKEKKVQRVQPIKREPLLNPSTGILGPASKIRRANGGGGLKKRSAVWDYFELTNNFVAEQRTARCLMCGREVSRKKSSTWAMMSHLTTFHKEIDLKREPLDKYYGNGYLNGAEAGGGEVITSGRIKKEKVDRKTSEPQFVVGSFGELQLATPEVIQALKQKGITITKYAENASKSGRLSPTSAAVASISETDAAVNSLLNQSVQISNADGVNISMNELLDGNAEVECVSTDSTHKQFVTQYAKDKNTGGLIEVRIPQSQESSKDTSSKA